VKIASLGNSPASRGAAGIAAAPRTGRPADVTAA
jgi:hypothetical protein